MDSVDENVLIGVEQKQAHVRERAGGGGNLSRLFIRDVIFEHGQNFFIIEGFSRKLFDDRSSDVLREDDRLSLIHI